MDSAAEGRPSHVRENHDYPRVPEGIGICDDPVAGGNHFFYRHQEIIVHRDDTERVVALLSRMFERPPTWDEPAPSPAGLPFHLITFRSPVDTVDVMRRLRAAPISRRAPDPPRVWVNHVLGLQSHTKWGNGVPPRPHSPLSPMPSGANLPGAGVRVGVLDTGLENQPWLDGHWVPAGGKAINEVRDKKDDDHDGLLDASAGHGTFIAGTILQHAPGAEVVVEKLADDAGCVHDWELHQIMPVLLGPQRDQLDVLNLSFGGYSSDNRPPPCLTSALEEALDINPQLVVVASAGNDASKRPMWPAALHRVVGVGALDRDGKCQWSLSNYGSWVGAWSVGVDLPSTFVKWGSRMPWGRRGLQAQMSYPSPPIAPGRQRFCGWAEWSGTSFAAARVSGAIAASLRRDGRDPREVVFDLIRNSPHRYQAGGIVEPATFVS